MYVPIVYVQTTCRKEEAFPDFLTSKLRPCREQHDDALSWRQSSLIKPGRQDRLGRRTQGLLSWFGFDPAQKSIVRTCTSAGGGPFTSLF